MSSKYTEHPNPESFIMQKQNRKCLNHSVRDASWHCPDCDSYLCESCTKSKAFGSTVVKLCTKCERAIRPYGKAKDDLPGTYYEYLPQAIRYPFNLNGVLMMAGLAVVAGFLKLVPFVGGIFSGGLVFSFLFNILNHSAMGKRSLPEPADFRGVSESLVMPMLRGLASYAVIVLPIIFYISTIKGLPNSLQDDVLLKWFLDPFLLILLIAGLLYFPIAMVVAALNESVIDVLNPLLGINAIRKIPTPYFVTTVVVFGILIVDIVVEIFLAYLFGSIFILGSLLINTVSYLILAVMFHILGMLVYYYDELTE